MPGFHAVLNYPYYVTTFPLSNTLCFHPGRWSCGHRAWCPERNRWVLQNWPLQPVSNHLLLCNASWWWEPVPLLQAQCQLLLQVSPVPSAEKHVLPAGGLGEAVALGPFEYYSEHSWTQHVLLLSDPWIACKGSCHFAKGLSGRCSCPLWRQTSTDISCIFPAISLLLYPIIISFFRLVPALGVFSVLFLYPCLLTTVPAGLWFQYYCCFSGSTTSVADTSLWHLKQSHPSCSRTGRENSIPAKLFFFFMWHWVAPLRCQYYTPVFISTWSNLSALLTVAGLTCLLKSKPMLKYSSKLLCWKLHKPVQYYTHVSAFTGEDKNRVRFWFLETDLI